MPSIETLSARPRVSLAVIGLGNRRHHGIKFVEKLWPLRLDVLPTPLGELDSPAIRIGDLPR